MTHEKKLVRSRSDRMLCGVCGGLGDTFGIDPVFVRLAFVLLMAANGIGLLVYIALCIIIPEETAASAAGSNGSQQRSTEAPQFEPLGSRQD